MMPDEGNESMDTKKSPASQTESAKKAYRSPELSVFGDVRRLTAGGGGAKNDGLGMPATKACWIAEALYGVHAPRVVLVRAWLARCYGRGDWWALVLVPLYVRFGERIAVALGNSSFARKFFRLIFDHAVGRASREFAVERFSQREPA
jgi:hypothetical protein